MTPEQRQRISDAKRGRSNGREGVKHTEDTRRLISERTRDRTPRGDAHYAWQGGVTEARRKGRKLPGYKAWRRIVREKADGACECCQSDHGKGRMHAHHIEPFAVSPSLAIEPTNGVWLCDDCHASMH